MRNNGALHSPLKNLRKDLYAVARDAEALLKATAEVTNERVQEVRSRTEKTVRAAMDTLSNDELRNRVRRAAESTDEYVRERPWAMIGAAAGVGLLILAFLAGIWALYLKFFEATSFVQTPLPLLVSLCVIAGLMCLLMGLLAELIMRVYYESQSKTDYRIKSVLNARPEDAARNDH